MKTVKCKLDVNLKTKLPFDAIRAVRVSQNYIRIDLLYKGKKLMEVESPYLNDGDSIHLGNGIRGEVDVVVS